MRSEPSRAEPKRQRHASHACPLRSGARRKTPTFADSLHANPPFRAKVANLSSMYYNFTGGLQEMAPPVSLLSIPEFFKIVRGPARADFPLSPGR